MEDKNRKKIHNFSKSVINSFIIHSNYIYFKRWRILPRQTKDSNKRRTRKQVEFFIASRWLTGRARPAVYLPFRFINILIESNLCNFMHTLCLHSVKVVNSKTDWSQMAKLLFWVLILCLISSWVSSRPAIPISSIHQNKILRLFKWRSRLHLVSLKVLNSFYGWWLHPRHWYSINEMHLVFFHSNYLTWCLMACVWRRFG